MDDTSTILIVDDEAVVCVDGGGGRDEHVNWLLGRGYLVVVKVKNWQRATKLSKSVTNRHPDPKPFGVGQLLLKVRAVLDGQTQTERK